MPAPTSHETATLLRKRLDRAERALIRSGWTYTEGAEEWRPPFGPPASPLLDKIDQLRGLARPSPASPETETLLADWSVLPRDLYVTSVKSDGIVFTVECCSVPMAVGPEVRYSLAKPGLAQTPDLDRMKAALEACHEFFERRSSIRWSDPLRAQVRAALAQGPDTSTDRTSK